MKTKKLTLLLTAAMFLMGAGSTRKDSLRTTLEMVVIIRIPQLRLMPKRIRVLLLGMDGQNIHPGMIDA